MTLPSNTSSFSDNTTASFRVRLPVPVQLEGEWEIALVEVQYPYSWNNVKRDEPWEDNVILFELYQFPNTDNYDDVQLVPIHLPPGCYTTIDDFVKLIQKR